MEQINTKKTDFMNPSCSDKGTTSTSTFVDQFHCFAKKREEFFQHQLVNLETYLNQTLEEQNYKFSKGSEEEEKISIAKAKAREYFKNYACEIFRGIKGKFEDQQLHHIIPETFLQNSMDRLKLSISLSLNQLTDKIVKSASRDNSPMKSSMIKIQKKPKMGKTKIPRKALTVLKNWLTEHYQDPYPSWSEKMKLAEEAGISVKQVQNWFTNIRGRVWKRSINQEKFSSQIEDILVAEKQKSGPRSRKNKQDPVKG